MYKRQVKRLAAERLGDGGGMDTDTPIGNAYTYTDRTERAEEKKKEVTEIDTIPSYNWTYVGVDSVSYTHLP